MKTFIIISFFWINTFFTFGQRVHLSHIIYPQDLPQWEYKDFIKHNVKKVSAYSYEINLLGKLKRKGTPLYQKEFDKTNHKIFGMNSLRLSSTHSVLPLNKNKFETFYNDKGYITKEITSPILTKKEKKANHLDKIYWGETFYEYSDTLLIRKTCIYHQVDSILNFCHIDSTIYEYAYNSKNLETTLHTTKIAFQFLTLDEQTTPSTHQNCYGCHKKQLEQITNYTTDSLIKTISYYYTNGKLRLKKYFSYTKNKLPKTQIDSIWHNKTDIPYLEERIEFEYTNTGKTMKRLKYFDKKITSNSTTTYDKNNTEISYCSLDYDLAERCSYQSYVYQNNLLVSSTFKSEYGYKYSIKTDFLYNSKGLLIEERIYVNNKLKSAVRYFYEYY